MRLKNSKEAKKHREATLESQGGLDPILRIQITRAVLDHMHFYPYKCRAALQSEVNAFEGKVYNAYKRYLTHLTNKPLPEILRALAEYLEKDFGASPIHHTAIRDEIRPFKRLSIEEQIKTLRELNIVPADTRAKRVKQYRAYILSK